MTGTNISLIVSLVSYLTLYFQNHFFFIDTIGFKIFDIGYIMLLFFTIKLRYQLNFLFLVYVGFEPNILFNNKKLYQLN